MGRRKIQEENIRKIQFSKDSYYIVIPMDIMRKFRCPPASTSSCVSGGERTSKGCCRKTWQKQDHYFRLGKIIEKVIAVALFGNSLLFEQSRELPLLNKPKINFSTLLRIKLRTGTANSKSIFLTFRTAPIAVDQRNWMVYTDGSLTKLLFDSHKKFQRR